MATMAKGVRVAALLLVPLELAAVVAGSARRLRGPASAGLSLFLFAHPHCPCTRASIAELAETPADASDALRTLEHEGARLLAALNEFEPCPAA